MIVKLESALRIFVLTGLITAVARGETFEVPASIRQGMERDVTPELNGFLASVPDGATIRFPNKASYRIEGTLSLEGRKGLVIEGNSCTFRATDSLPDRLKKDGHKLWSEVRNRCQWRIEGSSDITLRNMRVIGASRNSGRSGDYDENREAQHAFSILGVTNVVLDSIHASDVFGDGIYISKESHGVTVRNSRIERTGRQGMAIGAAFGILIENNDITDSRRGLLDIEPYSSEWACGDIRVIGNRFGDSRLLALPMGGGGRIGTVIVANNVFSGPNGVPLVMHRTKAEGVKRGPFVFVGNVASIGGSSAPAFRFGDVDGVLIAGNSMQFNRERNMSVLSIGNGRSGVVGNHFEGAARIVSAPGINPIKVFGNSFETGNERKADVIVESKGYVVTVDLGNGAQLKAILRKGEPDGTQMEAVGLRTEKHWAWELRENGRIVEQAED